MKALSIQQKQNILIHKSTTISGIHSSPFSFFKCYLERHVITYKLYYLLLWVNNSPFIVNFSEFNLSKPNTCLFRTKVLVWKGFGLDRDFGLFWVQFTQDYGLFWVQVTQDFGLFWVQFTQDYGLFWVQLTQDFSLFWVQLTQDFIILCKLNPE
jgi:hypothetical protein